MATVLFVSGSYYPYATANAVCAKKFEDILCSKGHTVIYCNRKHDLFEPDYHTYDGTELYTVGKNSDLFFQTVEKLEGLDLPNHMGICYKYSNAFFRILMKLRNLGTNGRIRRSRADKHYIDLYSKTICDIVINRGVDVIVSVSMPFDSHRAVLAALDCLQEYPQVKRPRWMVYCIDAYWSKAGIKNTEIPAMKSIEKQVFDTCDKILFLDSVAPDYSGNEFDCFRDKMDALPLPLFNLSDDTHYKEGIETSSGYQHWLFAGTIYDDFRNAESLAEVIRLQKNRPIKVHLMGKFYPKSLAMLKEVQESMPDQVVIYGRQSYEFAKGSMQKADVLINLANDNTNQIPSKIFEYMACLKPVLNIYRNNEDVGTSFLRRYPLAFNLSTNNIEEQKRALRFWSQAVKDQSITRDDLRCIFHEMISETVTEKFYALFLQLVEEK